MPDNNMFNLRAVLCDAYFSRNGVDYSLTGVIDTSALEDPEEKQLTRGAFAGNKTGLIYTSGIKDSKTVTVRLVGLSAEYATLLNEMYKKEERTDFKVIDRKTGRRATFKDAIVGKRIIQENMGGEGDEEMAANLILRTYNVEYK